MTGSLLARGLPWALLMGLLAPAIAWGQVELIVPNTAGDSVTVFARTANGNTAPLRTISGAATRLDRPQAVALDPVADEIFVVNAGIASITVYPRTANGNVAPLRTITTTGITLTNAGLNEALGIALDAVNGEIFVVDSDQILVFSRTANGSVRPLRSIVGAATGLSAPTGILVDLARNEVVVTNFDASSVTTFSRTASGDVAPLRALVGAATGLGRPMGLALDPVTNQLLVANSSPGSVTAYARTASGNTAPLRTLAGAGSGLITPVGLAVDPIHHELLVSDFNDNPVRVFPREAAGSTAPLRTLVGTATGLDFPNDLIAPDLSPLLSTGPGAGGGPHVRLFRFDTTEFTTTPVGGGFFAYDPAFTGGVQATLVRAQGSLFVVTGVGAGGGPHIRLFRVTDLLTGAVTPVGPGFFAYDPAFTGGARVAATTDPDGNLLIVTGVGPGGGPHVRVFRVTSLATGAVVPLGSGFFGYSPAFAGGVNVGAQ